MPSSLPLLRAVALATFAALLIPLSLAEPPSARAQSVQDTIPVGDEPTSIAILSSGTKAYVTNGAGTTVSVITLATQVTTSITVGSQPVRAVLRPGSGQLWVTNFGSDTVSVINTATDAVIATVSVDDQPWDIAFNASGTMAYVSHYSSGGGIVPITTSTLTLGATIPSGPFGQGIAVQPTTGHLWTTLTNANQVRIVDPANPGSPTSITVGAFPNDILFSTDGTRAWVSNGGISDPGVSVIDTGTRAVIDELFLGSGFVIGVSQSPDGRFIFANRVETDTTSTLWVIDAASRTPLHGIPVGRDTWSMAMTPDSNRVYAVSNRDDYVAKVDLEVDRLFGATRIETAVAISKEAFPGGSAAVYVANGSNFPDALAAGPAAAIRNAPLLLVNRDSVPQVVRNEITRLFPGTIYIVGGTGAVSSTVAAQLASTGADIVRLAGPDRYATGRAVVANAYELTGPSDSTTVDVLYVATGRGFPDALSAGPAAASAGGPVILVDGIASKVPSATLGLIAQLNPQQVVIAGGTGAVSAGIRNQLAALYPVTRLAGPDRYATSAAINAYAFESADTVLWSTGADFPDALAGVALAAQVGGPIMLVRPSCAPLTAKNDLWRLNADQLFLLGGTGPLSAAVQRRVSC